MNNRTKLIITILGLLLSLLFSYKLAISKTLEYKKSYNELKQQAILFENTPKQLSFLKKKELYLDSLLKSYQLGETSIQNSLLKTINKIVDSSNLKIIDFKEPHEIPQNNLTIKSYDFTVQGGYNEILSLVYTLEQKKNFGEIINLNLSKQKNYRKNKNYLQARVLLKSYY